MIQGITRGKVRFHPSWRDVLRHVIYIALSLWIVVGLHTIYKDAFRVISVEKTITLIPGTFKQAVAITTKDVIVDRALLTEYAKDHEGNVTLSESKGTLVVTYIVGANNNHYTYQEFYPVNDGTISYSNAWELKGDTIYLHGRNRHQDVFMGLIVISVASALIIWCHYALSRD